MGEEFWNREELYAEVWEKPLVKVATKYGISAVALGKACRKLQIPLTGRGYWTQKEFGKPVQRLPLPDVTDLPRVRRMKMASASAEDGASRRDPNDLEIVRIAAVEATTIDVDSQAQPHKLVSTARRLLRHARTDDKGLLIRPYDEPCLDIRVSKAALDRGLHLMNAIIRGLENEKFSVGVQRGREGTGVEIFEQRVPFSIVEKVRVKSRREVKEYSWTRTIVEHEPTGELEVRIGGYTYGIRKSWRDGKTRKLESLLSQCIGGLMRTARQLRIEAEQAKQRELERQKKQQELADLAVLIAEEEKRVRDLDTWVTNWLRAEQIRSFIAALEKVWTEQGHDLSADAPKGQRIIWMRQQADRLDPMLASPPSILDRKSELARW